MDAVRCHEVSQEGCSEDEKIPKFSKPFLYGRKDVFLNVHKVLQILWGDTNGRVV